MTMRSRDIRFAFFGTPAIAVAALDALEAQGLIPALIVTQPDRAAGRGHALIAPPVKEWALARGIDVLQPEKLDDAFIGELANTEWDAFALVAYGALLPAALLSIPRHGTLNMHPSLLPKLRGPSPITSAILTDEHPTGVTVMLIDEKMDHGPVLAQEVIEVTEWPPKRRELEELLAAEGGALLAETLPLWVAGTIEAAPQDDAAATYCAKVKKEDGLLDLAGDPALALRKIRAFDGWPGTYAFFERAGKTLRVQILEAHADPDGSLAIDTVKPEGKGAMPYADFLRSGAVPSARAK
ncbi:MAG TPA: methionyl-tRNA formyltransferase [Candidatus Paceibacterota bacterium]|nr:methionyl-tRNA formyltransferase [Candidatus Paceibacterota bacterium]